MPGDCPEAARLERLVDRAGLAPPVSGAKAVPHLAWPIRISGPDVNPGLNLEPNKINTLETARRPLNREDS